MRQQRLFSLLVVILIAFCPFNGLAQDPDAAGVESAPPAYEKRVLFAPLQVPSMTPEKDQPTLFVPALFRPPIPWLKLDDRYESFVGNVEIQAELQEMEQLFLNPFGELGRELTSGIETEIGAYGEVVHTYKFGGGRFEFSSSAGPYGRPGSWGTGYDYNSWLGNSNRGSDDQ